MGVQNVTNFSFSVTFFFFFSCMYNFREGKGKRRVSSLSSGHIFYKEARTDEGEGEEDCRRRRPRDRPKKERKEGTSDKDPGGKRRRSGRKRRPLVF